MSYTIYRHLAIEGAKPPPTESQLRVIEDELGAKLPLSFKEYLNVANGGYLEYMIDVPIGTGQIEGLSFCGLFSADIGTFCDETFVGEIRSGREYTKIPKGVLPFARDGGGSIVYLDLTSEGNGRVVAFVEGLPGWAGKRTESAFVQLASSFDEYVDKLKIDLDAVIDHLENDASKLSHITATEEWLDIGLPNWRSNSSLISALQVARERIGQQV
ncbi:MAG: SMI1/KNR4 family protein [Burkholderiales bacterium]|nr:SMI1/KNR4 family protein [Burkholderiales bacterium]